MFSVVLDDGAPMRVCTQREFINRVEAMRWVKWRLVILRRLLKHDLGAFCTAELSMLLKMTGLRLPVGDGGATNTRARKMTLFQVWLTCATLHDEMGDSASEGAQIRCKGLNLTVY